MTPLTPAPDSPARRSADPANELDLFIADDDEPGSDNPPAASDGEGDACAP